jgi:hypothetical protein
MKFTLSCLTLLSVVYAAAVPPAADRVVSAEVYMGGNHTSDVSIHMFGLCPCRP